MNFMKIHPAVPKLFHEHRWADRQSDRMSLIGALQGSDNSKRHVEKLQTDQDNPLMHNWEWFPALIFNYLVIAYNAISSIHCNNITELASKPNMYP
jgi:hypothetical protein